MITRRTFTSSCIKILSIGYLLPIAELLNACTYKNKEDLLEPNGSKRLSLISPNGGENFDNVKSLEIKWTQENISKINILLSHDGGITWSLVKKDLPAGVLSNSIDITDKDIFAENCLVKIENSENNTLFDVSDGVFKIANSVNLVQKSMKLLTPNQSIKLVVGQNYLITWNATNVSYFKVQFSSDGTNWITLAELNANSYNWILNTVNTSNALIKISDASNEAICDISDQFFTIVTELEIDLNLHPALQNVGGYEIFVTTSLNKFLVKKISLTEYKTFSLICTHAGCITDVQSDQSFHCPCHGSSFDANGNVTNGPANQPLNTYRTEYFLALSKVVVYSY